MTQPEFAAWVRDRQDARRYELLNGRIVMNPPAAFPHGSIAAELCRLIANHVREHRLGMVFDSSQGFELPSGDTLEPDVSFISKRRWRAPKPGEFIAIAPDVAVEVLSPSTKARDRSEKKAIYQRSGVREYWLVDSSRQEIAVFSLAHGRYGKERIFTAHEKLRSTVVRGLTFAVGEVFP